MRMYRLGEGENTEGWPFLHAGHAYLADGTPLTEYDRNGRIVPSRDAFERVDKICAGGRLRLADRENGITALARALDARDVVRAPILLLQLQIDPVGRLIKFNPWHKPPGPGGGQFTFGPEGDASAQGATPDESRFEPVDWDLGGRVISSYQTGVFGPDVDAAHNLVTIMTQKAMLEVSKLNFKPGMPGYGTALHKAFKAEIDRIRDPLLRSDPIFFLGKEVKWRWPGSSIPDAAYGDQGCPKIVWELKTGSATDTSIPRNVLQRLKAKINTPCSPAYEYLLVVGLPK